MRGEKPTVKARGAAGYARGMRWLLVLGIAACGEGEAPFEPVVQYEVDPSAQAMDELIFDTRPFFQLAVGLDTCTVTGSSGERYLLVLTPPEAVAGQTYTISSQTSLSMALAAGEAHASVTIQEPHPDAGVELALGGTVTLRSVSADEVSARVDAMFEAGEFKIDIVAPACR